MVDKLSNDGVVMVDLKHTSTGSFKQKHMIDTNIHVDYCNNKNHKQQQLMRSTVITVNLIGR
jgi:hypothetical protein